MSEPTGHRVDGTPWEEARPPHLPDAVARLSPWTFLFLAAALLHVGIVWREYASLGPLAEPSSLLELGSGRVTAIIVSLYGVALFVRHPDARRTVPLLAFGLGLFMLNELLALAADPFLAFVRGLTQEPWGASAPPVSPTTVAWSVFTTLVSIFAVLYTAAGLSTARRLPPPAAQRRIDVAVAVIVAITMGLWVWSLLRILTGLDVGVVVTLVLGLALTVASTVAWAYLLRTTAGGWIAGEAPRLGWAVASVAAALFLGIRVIGSVPVEIAPGTDTSGLLFTLGAATVLSWLLLLLAFALALPATSAPPATGDRPGATPTGSAGS